MPLRTLTLAATRLAVALRRFRRAASAGRAAGRTGRAGRVGRVACAVCVYLWVSLAGTRAEAAPFDLKGQDWEGLSQFLRLAEAELGIGRVVPTSTLDLHKLSPADAVVLVHPTRALDVDELEAFLRAGGRIVLLDEYGTGDDLLAWFHIHRRPMPSRPAQMIRGNPALAIAEPAPGVENPAVRDVTHVVTNHATGLDQPALSPLLVVRGDGEDDVLLALSGNVGRGHLVAVGDGSVLINSMLRYPGNQALALSLVRYALEDAAWGKRGGKLYVLANGFETIGAFGADTPFADAASQARQAVVDALETLRQGGMSPNVAFLAAVGVGIGIIVWTGARVGKTHKLATPRFARTVPVVAHGGIAGHAAVLGAPGTSRALAILELKSALEEELATKLGLPRAPSADQLVARLRAARMLDEKGGRALLHLLASMARIETRLARRAGGPAFLRESPSDAEVIRVAAHVRELRQRLRLAPRGDEGEGRRGRDTFGGNP